MALPTFLTLDQMLKAVPRNRPSLNQVIRIFRDSVFLAGRTFKGIGGAADSYEIEAELPAAEKRALNQDFTDTGGGRTGLEHEALRIYGLKLREDEAASIMGMTMPSMQNEQAAKATRLALEFDSWNGDPSVDPLAVGGFQYWAENSGNTALTSFSAGTTAGGAALSIFQLREVIDQCNDPREIVLGSTLRNRLTGGAENTAAAGFITTERNDFGKRIFFFDGLPLTVMEEDSSQARIGAFTEADQPAGANTATSLYVLGSEYYWFQNGGPDISELAQTGSQLNRRLMWLLANAGPQRSVVRLKHIGNIPVVA